MTQQSIAERLAGDARPVADWAEGMHRLRARLYPLDADLSRELDDFVRRLESSSADLACIGYDDPAAPHGGAPAKDVLAYLFARWPDWAHEYRRVMTRADQLLGRRQLLEVLAE